MLRKKRESTQKESDKNKTDFIGRLRYKICVSGAADTGHCAETTREKAEEIGREIARRGCVLVTGATTGTPYWAAKGAKEEGGMVMGISPAATKTAHIKTYKLPTDYHDVIIYTGFNYSGRNLLLVRSSDAVVAICGRIGTLNEFTIAFEDEKPIGVLEGTGGIADELKGIVERAHKGPVKIAYADTPKELLDKLIDIIESEEKR